MRPWKRFLPFTSVGSAAWFAFRHRRPLWDWGTWAVRSAPRLLSGEHGDVVTEARLRMRLAGDDRLDGEKVRVEVDDGRARVSGEVERGHRKVVAGLVEDAPGVDSVDDDLRERGRRRRARASA